MWLGVHNFQDMFLNSICIMVSNLLINYVIREAPDLANNEYLFLN